MTLGTQVKLMRVLQEKCLQRLGGKETISVDVRVLAATHRDLEAAIQQRLFREDLYYRLSVVVLTLPPLRQRREDIPELARYFLRRHGPELGNARPSIQPEAIEFLQNQPWPGNVRELENVMRKALLSLKVIRLTSTMSAPRSTTGTNLFAARRFGEYIDSLVSATAQGK